MPGLIQSCSLCQGKLSPPIVDLGESPLANNFTTEPQLDQPKYPLRLVKCLECEHVQLDFYVEPEVLFKNYLFVSGTSAVTQRYFENLAFNLVQQFSLPRETLILDIASSDGTLLKHFRKLGMNILGVEPAENLAAQCNQEGIPTIAKFFNLETAKEIEDKYGKIQMITSCNVLAHNYDLNPFVEGIKQLLHFDGIWIVEVCPLHLLPQKPGEIYSEHFHYWELNSLRKYLNKYKLEILEAETTPNMGGTLRVYVAHQKFHGRRAARKPSAGFLNLLKYSDNVDGSLEEINQSVQKTKEKLYRYFDKYQGKKIAIYGCSAKLTTILHACQIDTSAFVYAVDNNILKQNRFVPSTNIQIFSPDRLKEEPPDVILVGAPSFLISMKARHSDYKGEWLVI